MLNLWTESRVLVVGLAYVQAPADARPAEVLASTVPEHIVGELRAKQFDETWLCKFGRDSAKSRTPTLSRCPTSGENTLVSSATKSLGRIRRDASSFPPHPSRPCSPHCSSCRLVPAVDSANPAPDAPTRPFPRRRTTASPAPYTRRTSLLEGRLEKGRGRDRGCPSSDGHALAIAHLYPHSSEAPTRRG